MNYLSSCQSLQHMSVRSTVENRSALPFDMCLTMCCHGTSTQAPIDGSRAALPPLASCVSLGGAAEC